MPQPRPFHNLSQSSQTEEKQEEKISKTVTWQATQDLTNTRVLLKRRVDFAIRSEDGSLLFFFYYAVLHRLVLSSLLFL